LNPPEPGSASPKRNFTAEHRADRIILLIGLMLSVLGFCWLFPLVAVHSGLFHKLSAGVYGCALVLMYLSSTLLHWVPDRHPRSVLRIIDHSAIYVLIAATYTPFTLPNISAAWARQAFTFMWVMVLIGITFKMLWIHRAAALSLVLYLAMGWSIIAFLGPLSAALPPAVLHGIFLGGIFYSVGAICYACKPLPFRMPIWHLFVIAGSTAHYVAVWRYLAN
jgi:hemolysin III